MENRAHALAAGLFILAFAVFLAGIVWWFSDHREVVKTYTLVTQGNVTGLNLQAQVRYRGMLAGKVSHVQVDPAEPKNILVDIRVRQDIPITHGTRAQLAYQGVTGLGYIMLDDKGNQPEPLLPGEARIPLSGGTLERLTDGALQMVEKLNALTQRIDRLMDEQSVAHIRSVVSRSDNVMAQVENNMTEATAALKQVRKAMSDENIAKLSKALTNIQDGAGQISPAMQDVKKLLTQLDGVSKRLNESSLVAGSETLPRINHLITELTTTSRRMSRLLEEVSTSPQMVIYGREPVDPGPGEEGYSPPSSK